MDELTQLIRVWSNRARLQSSLHWLFLGAAGGLGVSLIIAVLARVFPILSTDATIIFSVACLLIGTATAFAWPWLRTLRATPATWARRFDQQFVLKERLSTALELREGLVVTNNDRMRKQQQSDAAQAAQNVDVRTALPLRLSRRFVLYAFALALALAATIALPNPQQEVLANRAQMQQAVEEQLKQLEATRQDVEQSTALNDNQKKQVIQALDDAQKALSDPSSTPEKALAAINDAQSKLDALRDQSWPNQRDDLQRAGQALAPNELTNPLANALENSNFQKAADALRNMTQPNGQPLNDPQRQRVADQLEQMARNVQNTDPATAQQLRDAAQKLRQGQDQAAQQALNKAADALNQAGQKETVDQQVNKAQASMEDARRAVSEASNKENGQESNAATQSQDQKGQSQTDQTNQAGANGQPGSNSQNGKQPGAQSGTNSANADQGQSGSQGQTQTGSAASNTDPSGNAQAGVVNGPGDNAHHEDVGSDNSVFAPSRLNNSGQNVVLPEDKGQNVPNPNGSNNPGVSNQASVPYQQVFPQYAKTADEALANGQVPSDLRDYVHDYFSSLDPRQRR
jgi:hypothetical protein